MSITISNDLLQQINLSEQELLIELAVFLYANGRLSFGKAKRLAGLSHLDFQKELAKQKVPLNYDLEEFHKDLKTLGLKRNDHN